MEKKGEWEMAQGMERFRKSRTLEVLVSGSAVAIATNGALIQTGLADDAVPESVTVDVEGAPLVGVLSPIASCIEGSCCDDSGAKRRRLTGARRTGCCCWRRGRSACSPPTGRPRRKCASIRRCACSDRSR